MKQKREPWHIIVITAMLSALGGAIITSWLPNLATWVTRPRIMIVQVERDRQPVKGVQVAVSKRSGQEDPFAIGTTNDDGIVELTGVDIELYLVKATLCEGNSEWTYARTHQIEVLPYPLNIDVNKDFFDPHPAVYSTTPPIASIVTVKNLEVSSGRTYFTASLQDKSVVYSDRDYRYTDIPASILGKTYIITANDDKFGGKDFDFLIKLDVDREVTVYVAHSDDYLNKPAWLADFRDTNLDLAFDVDGQKVVLSLYEKRFPAGRIVLGGNVTPTETENHAMYTVVLSEN